jgi:hypothetical protein
MSRNPYHVDGAEPTLKKSVLVFMDILGYSAMIRDAAADGRQQELLRALYRTLLDERNWLEDKNIPAELRDLSQKDSYALKAFTDNIVMGWPVRDDAEAELGTALSKFAFFQLSMVMEGFFIRGAISVGEAYVDEIAVYGSALTEAYGGESSLARDPRIILTSSAVEAAKGHIAYYAAAEIAPHAREILRDSDGQWFLNYLECVLIAEHEHGPFFSELSRHRVAVEDKLRQHKGNPAIWPKYAWVAGYHNYFCDLHPQYFSEQHKVNVDLFRATPSRITDHL